MMHNPFNTFRQIGKAWATAPRIFKPDSYYKVRQVPVKGPVQPCRGAARAARRRKYKTMIRAARRA